MATVSEVSQALQLAVRYHRANRLAEAEQVYRYILAKQPDQPDALYWLSVLARQLGKYSYAEQLLSAVLQVQPQSVKAWFSLGNLRKAQGQWPEAVEAYQQALALQPDSVALYNNLGSTLEEQGKWSEALACYQKALDLQPECLEAQVNWANVLHAQGKLPRKKQAHYAALNNELGLSLKKEGDLTAAVACYRQAITLQPELASAHYNLGWALQQQGNLQEAIACYQQALELNPSYAEVYNRLGKIYQEQNNLKEAIAAYRQGLKLLNPRYAEAVAAYQGSAPAEAEPALPQLPQGEVMVGGHQFPAIPPVSVSEDKRPFWSVVIPVYAVSKRIPYLLECLASVLAQWSRKEEMEILVIDDASPLPLAELVNSLGAGVVRYYRNRSNLGMHRNFNLGVALSRGQWIHLLHDDDYVLSGFYSRLKKSLEGCSDSVGAAFTGYENINEKGEVVFSQQVYGEHRGIAEDFLRRIGVANPLNPPAVVIRRATYERLGGYRPELTYTGDWEFYKRAATFSDWWYEPGILARYRKHSHNITTEFSLSGAKGTCIRSAIEISESYLPEEITAKSRSYHFNRCLADTAIPLKAGRVTGALRLLQEALRLDRSSQAVAKLFAWLGKDEAVPLRDEIVSKLLSIECSQ